MEKKAEINTECVDLANKRNKEIYHYHYHQRMPTAQILLNSSVAIFSICYRL